MDVAVERYKALVNDNVDNIYVERDGEQISYADAVKDIKADE